MVDDWKREAEDHKVENHVGYGVAIGEDNLATAAARNRRIPEFA